MLGVFRGVDLKGTVSTIEDKERQRKAVASLRYLIDAMVGNFFLSTYNCAGTFTYENQGRALSIAAIRQLGTKYIRGRAYNEARELRTSKNEKVLIAELIASRPWKNWNTIDAFIEEMEGKLEDWKQRVINGKLY